MFKLQIKKRQTIKTQTTTDGVTQESYDSSQDITEKQIIIIIGS